MPKKTPKKLSKPRLSEAKKNKVLLDLMMGLPKPEIAKRHKVGLSSVKRLEKDNQEILKEMHEEYLEKYQHQINQFLIKQTEDMMDILANAFEMAKKAVQVRLGKMQKGELVEKTREHWERDDDGNRIKIKSVPADDLDDIINMWDKVVGTYGILRKFDDDDQPR
jgi:AcrR family transcriptional regulator